jgi:nuclear pore complex protein Nup205
MDNIPLAEEFAEQSTGAGAPTWRASQVLLNRQNRLATLDLLIQDTELNRPFPNIALFLFFVGKVGIKQFKIPPGLVKQVYIFCSSLSILVYHDLKGNGKKGTSS